MGVVLQALVALCIRADDGVPFRHGLAQILCHPEEGCGFGIGFDMVIVPAPF